MTLYHFIRGLHLYERAIIMKKFAVILLGILLWSGSYSQKSGSIILQGLQMIELNSDNVNEVVEVEGIIAFATQIGVELYLHNRKIANFTYISLTGKSSNNRNEEVNILCDTVCKRLYVIDDVGIGIIQYETTTAWNLYKYPKRLTELQQECSLNEDVITIYAAEKYSKTLNDLKIEIIPKDLPGFPIEIFSKKTDTLHVEAGQLLLNGTILMPFVGEIAAVEKEQILCNEEKTSFLIATKSQGLFRLEFDLHSPTLPKLTGLEIHLPTGVMVKKLRSLTYLDRWDALCIGSIGNGAFIWSHLRSRAFTPIYNPRRGEDDKEHHYWSMASVGEKGLFLAGNDVGKIKLFDHNRPEIGIDNYSFQIGDQILSIAKFGRDSFLVGSSGGKLSAIAVVENKIKKVSHHFPDKFKGQINAILPIGEDKVLIASPRGLFRCGKRKTCDTLTKAPISFINSQTEGSNPILGGQNKLWFYNLNSDTLDRIFFAENRKDQEITYAFQTEGDQLLYCTKDNFFSLAFLENKSPGRIKLSKIKRIDEKAGMLYYGSDGEPSPIHTVYGGVYDQVTEKAFLSTNFGILSFDPKSDELDFFGPRSTGLSTLEFNTNAFERMGSNLIFGSLKGGLVMNIEASMITNNKAGIRLKGLPQLWRKTDRSTSKDIAYGSFMKIPPGEIDTIGFQERDRNYLLVTPDYSMLSRDQITISDTLNLISGILYAPEKIYGTFVKDGRRDTIIYQGLKSGPGSFNLFQHPDLEYKRKLETQNWLIITIFATFVSLLLGLLSYRAFQKGQVQTEKYRLRRKLFAELGRKLDRAESYPEVHEAFTSIKGKDIIQILEATKLSLYQYRTTESKGHPGYLQLLGHADANPLPGEDNSLYDQIETIRFDLKEDIGFPAVHFWNHKMDEDYLYQEDTSVSYALVVNRASGDFYTKNQIERKTPKRGKATESFIFLLIGTRDNPFGLLTIQNERPNAYSTSEKVKEYLDLMNIIGRFAEYRIGELDEARKREREYLKRLFYERFSTFFRDRMETHFLGDVIDLPIKLLSKNDPNYKQGKAFGRLASRLFKELHSTEIFTSLKKSSELCRQYLQVLEPIIKHTRNPAYNIEYSSVIAPEVINDEIPSFIVINLIHNAVTYFIKNQKGENYRIQIVFKAKRKGKHLIVYVEDNGVGFSERNLKEFKRWRSQYHTISSDGTLPIGSNAERKNSTRTIIEFFKEIEQHLGVDIEIILENISANDGGYRWSKSFYQSTGGASQHHGLPAKSTIPVRHPTEDRPN